jgi:hypothetical protein
MFQRYIGIDYSGAATADSPLPGLRAYVAERDTPPVEARPTSGRARHWTRRGLATWLLEQLSREPPTLVGIDHGFGLPLAYIERHGLPRTWRAVLDDFCEAWPTDEPGVRVEEVRRCAVGDGSRRRGHARWRRLTDRRAGAKSVFHFDVPGSVAKSTHAGLPFLRDLLKRCSRPIHAWPFDGWRPPADRHVLVEAYPSLWRDSYAQDDRTNDQHDAYVIATHLRELDRTGGLSALFEPKLSETERAVASVEGWIFGVA